MNILYITNTFTPHVGGVARSIESFTGELRRRGHRVLIIAPHFADDPRDEEDVIRVPAIINFNDTDFSVVLPLPKGLKERIEEFAPDIIHSHHPFLLGMTALRLARPLSLPLVFTHHTLYERYSHYVTSEAELAGKFIIDLATSYANLADLVLAPSESIAGLLAERGVKRPIETVPTGVALDRFARGDGQRFRRERGIPPGAFAVGHMGRLAPEKNLRFLARCVKRFLKRHRRAVFVVVGDGPERERLEAAFRDPGLAGRTFFTGILQGDELASALHAMDLFCFASQSETQGMVLTEAMAAGLPVVALDAFGVRDVVADGVNGRLVSSPTVHAFSDALHSVYALSGGGRRRLTEAALATARDYSLETCVDAVESHYRSLIARFADGAGERQEIEPFLARLKTEWDIFRSLTSASGEALGAVVETQESATGEPAEQG